MTNSPVALVTGGSRGIGRAISLHLARDGHRVVINYRADHDAAAGILAEIQAGGGHAVLVQADVAQGPDRDRLVSTVLGRYGRIDVLVNNAGIAPAVRRDVLEMSEASYDKVLAVNLKAPLFLTQSVSRVMMAQHETDPLFRGTIINISSIRAFAPNPNAAEYSISKAGLSMVTRLFAARLAAHGIHAYEVRPGLIETDMAREVKPHYDRRIAAGAVPIARWGRPEEVARAVTMLAHGHLGFSTGDAIHVDGGVHIRRL